jgi:hypothetical protein
MRFHTGNIEQASANLLRYERRSLTSLRRHDGIGFATITSLTHIGIITASGTAPDAR